MPLNRQMVFQVTMPALLVALTMLGTSLLGIRSINSLQDNRDKIVFEHVQALQAAQDLENYMRIIRLHSFVYVMDMTPERWAKVERDQNEFEKKLDQIRQSAFSSEEKRVIEEIDSGYRKYRQELEHTSRNPPGPSRDDILKWSDSHPIRYIVVPCEELLELNRQAMRATAERSAQESDRTRTRMILLAVLGSAGGLIGGFGVAWALSRGITRLSVRLQDVHAHLDQEVASLRLMAEGSNLQMMDRQVGQILERVREVVSQLQRQEREELRAGQLAAVGQLAASIAHEVRNPLTSIKLLVGAALCGRGTKGLSEADLRVIHEEIDRLEGKVQALLDFARPQEMKRQAANVGELVQQVVELVKARMRQQSVSLKLELPTEPLTAELDRNQFKGVLVNLILNALDAMPGGGTLEVHLGRVEPNQLQLTVTDSGPGIGPDAAKQLFTPFFSTKPTGTGLGLSVSRRIVQAHGGSLTVSNRPEGGARFTIALAAGGSVSAAAASRPAVAAAEVARLPVPAGGPSNADSSCRR